MYCVLSPNSHSLPGYIGRTWLLKSISRKLILHCRRMWYLHYRSVPSDRRACSAAYVTHSMVLVISAHQETFVNYLVDRILFPGSEGNVGESGRYDWKKEREITDALEKKGGRRGMKLGSSHTIMERHSHCQTFKWFLFDFSFTLKDFVMSCPNFNLNTIIPVTASQTYNFKSSKFNHV